MDVIGDKGVVSLNAFNQNVQLFDDRAGHYALVPFATSGDPPLVQGFVDAIRNDTEPPVTGEDGRQCRGINEHQSSYRLSIKALSAGIALAGSPISRS